MPQAWDVSPCSEISSAQPSVVRSRSLDSSTARTGLFSSLTSRGGRTSQFASVTRTVYTQEARQGIFRAITRNTTVNPETGRTLSRNSGAVLDPVTGTIQAILALTPLPNDFSSLFNGGSSNSEGRDGLNLAAYRFNAPGNEDANLQTYKVDHLLNDKQTLSVRVNWGNVDRDKGDFVNNVFEPFPGIPNRARLEKQRSGSLNWIASLSPSVTNEFRIGISRNQRTFTSTENVAGAISINAPGTDPYRRDNGLDFPRQTFQVTDNLTWAKGNHSMKMGFTVQTTILNRNAGANAIDINASPIQFGRQCEPDHLCGSCNSTIPSNDRNRSRRRFNFLTGRIGAIGASFRMTGRSPPT